MDKAEILVTDEAIAAKVGLARFYSLTLRCFKLPGLEDRCEEFGQFATYLGTMKEMPVAFDLDDSHRFEAGRPVPVCGNTALMVKKQEGGGREGGREGGICELV
jgi:hypothetical protein